MEIPFIILCGVVGALIFKHERLRWRFNRLLGGFDEYLEEQKKIKIKIMNEILKEKGDK